MQAQGMKRFSINHVRGPVLAAVMLAATFTGVAVLQATDNLPYRDGGKAQAVAPVTISNEAVAFDEGIAPAVRPAITSNRPTDQRAALREGLITGAGAATDTIQAYPSAGQGEGIIGGYNTYPVPAVIEYESMRFLELNLLPDAGTAAAVGAADLPEMRFWDENVTLLTGGDTTQQRPQISPGFTAE
jgi:hypothetical protein